MDITNVFKATCVVLLTLLGVYIVFIGLPILVTLLIAIIIASAVRPFVNRLAKIMPSSAAIIIVYGVITTIALVTLLILIPPMLNQLAIYIEQDWRLAMRIIDAQEQAESLISDFTNEEISLVSPDQIRETVSLAVEEFRASSTSLLRNLGTILGNIVLIIVMGAYWLTSHIEAKRFLLKLVPPKYRDNARDTINNVEHTLGSYVRGVVTIASIVAVLNFVPMQLFGIPNALALSLIIGALTIIPMIGGVIGGIIATLLTLITEPSSAIIVAIIFISVNTVENYILQPRIMSDEVGMNPLLVILYTSVGFILGDFVGALIAIPVMGTLHIILENYVIKPYRATMKDDTPMEEIVVEVEDNQQVVIKQKENKEDDAPQTENNPLTQGAGD